MDFPALHTYIVIYIQPTHQSTCALDFACKAIISQQRRLVKHNLHTNSSVCVSICQYAKLTIAASRIAPYHHRRIRQTTNKQSSSPHIYTARQPIRYIQPHTHPYSTMLGGYIHIESCAHMPIHNDQLYAPMPPYLYAYIHNVNIYVHTYSYCIYLYTYIPILRGKIKNRNPHAHAQEAGKIKPFIALAC